MDIREVIANARMAGVDGETILRIIMGEPKKSVVEILDDKGLKVVPGSDGRPHIVLKDGAVNSKGLPLVSLPVTQEDIDLLEQDEPENGVPLPQKNTPEMLRDDGRDRFCTMTTALFRFGYVNSRKHVVEAREILNMKSRGETRDIMSLAMVLNDIGCPMEEKEELEGCMFSSKAITSRSLRIDPSTIESLAKLGRVQSMTMVVSEKSNPKGFNRKFYSVPDLVKEVPQLMGERWARYVEAVDKIWKDLGERERLKRRKAEGELA